jgi:hypothetical protein
LCPPAPEAAFRETVNYLIQAAGYGDLRNFAREKARAERKKRQKNAFAPFRVFRGQIK